MKPLLFPPLTKKQFYELQDLRRATPKLQIQTRIDLVLLATHEQLSVSQVAVIVRISKSTVLRWLKRYLATGIRGLFDEPRSK